MALAPPRIARVGSDAAKRWNDGPYRRGHSAPHQAVPSHPIFAVGISWDFRYILVGLLEDLPMGALNCYFLQVPSVPREHSEHPLVSTQSTPL